MILLTTGQVVTHKNKLWYICGFEEVDGRTVYVLKRGCYIVKADETEIKVWKNERRNNKEQENAE